jgi:hypothetical protein
MYRLCTSHTLVTVLHLMHCTFGTAPAALPHAALQPWRCTRGAATAALHLPHGTRRSAPAALHPRRCTRGAAPTVPHPRRYTRGAAPAVRHPQHCTHGTAPAVLHPRGTAPAAPHPRRCTCGAPPAARFSPCAHCFQITQLHSFGSLLVQALTGPTSPFPPRLQVLRLPSFAFPLAIVAVSVAAAYPPFMDHFRARLHQVGGAVAVARLVAPQAVPGVP